MNFCIIFADRISYSNIVAAIRTKYALKRMREIQIYSYSVSN
jgi:hypothetical protein